jgi:hypothetical protein
MSMAFANPELLPPVMKNDLFWEEGTISQPQRRPATVDGEIMSEEAGSFPSDGAPTIWQAFKCWLPRDTCRDICR